MWLTCNQGYTYGVFIRLFVSSRRMIRHDCSDISTLGSTMTQCLFIFNTIIPWCLKCVVRAICELYPPLRFKTGERAQANQNKAGLFFIQCAQLCCGKGAAVVHQCVFCTLNLYDTQISSIVGTLLTPLARALLPGRRRLLGELSQ